MALSKQEEKFSLGLFEGLSQRQAYLAAFPQAKKWRPSTIDSKACRLSKESKIQARLEEIKRENANLSLFSRADVLKKLQEIATTPDIKFKGSDILKALELIIKMCGFECDTEALADVRELLVTVRGVAERAENRVESETD